MSYLKIADLVGVPPVRTVVRLADLSDAELRRSMVDNFILTGEVSFTITTLLNKISSLKGQGFFVQGNYGSGKSHLLSILSLILNDPAARRIMIEKCALQEPKDTVLASALEKTPGAAPLTVEISLLEHSNREYLEEIFLSYVDKNIGGKGSATSSRASCPGPLPPAGWRQKPRQEAFKILQEALSRGNWGGLVLLIDELSEFLRSKPDNRSYNEDVRFLQFLGEFAETIPAWVIATLQENIENTGAIVAEMLHKIKDRYPVRFHLAGKHVKEIVSRRLIQKKEGADKALAEIFGRYSNSFTRLPFSREDFFALYPVHPATVELLDELRPLFSQHRGVIDFIHYRLAGDPGRRIAPFQEKPADHLLTPDYIFDHFRDRIRETMETNPYSEQVFHYYEREISHIFPEKEDAATALRLLKILLLGALIPAQKHFTLEELTNLLLYRFTEWESGVNYDYIAEIMEKLEQQGAYVAMEESTVHPQDTTQNTYYIDLQADAALLIKKKLQHKLSTIPPGDKRVINALLPWADETYLPLNKLQNTPVEKREIVWQGTGRSGKIFFGAGDDFTPDLAEKLQAELKKEETDFVFWIASPSWSGNEKKQSFFLWEKSNEPLSGFSFWIPREINPAEEEELRWALAHRLLAEEYSTDHSVIGKQVQERLQGLLEAQQKKVKEIFRSIYFEGQLETGFKNIEPSAQGLITFEELLCQTVSETLKERYPRHAEIRPQSEQFTGSLLQRSLEHLHSPVLSDEKPPGGVQAAIEKCLMPLGIIQKRGTNYQLHINPKTSPLVAEFLGLLSEEGDKIGVEQLYWKLRKGPFGLNSEGFRSLALGMILSGAVSAYQNGRQLPPSQINYYRFWKIEELGPGTLIAPELQKILPEIPFLPARFRSGPLTFAAQQSMWEYVTNLKKEWEQKLEKIRNSVERLKEYRLLAMLNWDKIAKIIKRSADFLDEIKVTYASQEGLERFLAAFQSRPFTAEDFARLDTLHRFLFQDLENILRLGHYLKDPDLHIPEGEKYVSLHWRYQLLMELLNAEEILFEDKYRERIKGEFKLFQEEYSALYLQEHEQQVGEKRIRPYRSILKSSPYQLLQAFSRINALIIENDLVSINRQLSPILAKECSAAEKPLIMERPGCACGFKLGQKFTLPLVTELKARINEGLRQYVETLRQDDNKKQLEHYAASLKLVGKRHQTGPLHQLLQVDPRQPEIAAALSPWLNRNVIEHLNKALTGDAIIVERSADELREMISGRVFTREQLLQLFQTWLQGKEEEEKEKEKEKKQNNYIRVVGKNSPENNHFSYKKVEGAAPVVREDAYKEVLGQLQERHPELLHLLPKLGEVNFFMLALLSGWLSFQQGTDSNPVPQAAQLLELEKKDWPEEITKIAALGRSMLQEKEIWSKDYLSRQRQAIEARLEPAQLWEASQQQQTSISGLYRFDTLLEKLIEEPLFPLVVGEIFKNLASQLYNEEIESNLKVIKSSLPEALKIIKREAAGFSAPEQELLHEKQKTLTILNTLALCNLTLRQAEKAAQAPPQSSRAWENLYRQIAPFEKELSALEETLGEYRSPLNLSLPAWRLSYETMLKTLHEQFFSYYQQEPPEKKQTVARLLGRLPRWAGKKAYSGGVYLLILDGARQDIWQIIRDKIIFEHRLQVLKEGFTWALLPTVTEAQLEPLKEEGLLKDLINMDEGVMAELLREPSSLFQTIDNRRQILLTKEQPAGPFKALKFNFIDDKMHSTREDLHMIGAELLLQAGRKLLPVFHHLPAPSLILLFTDHGFRTNYNFSKINKWEEPRYLHGGCTFFEVLAPWALLEKE